MTLDKKTALIFPSKGLGDGLLMMIASWYLAKQGFNVTVYHNALKELAPLFPHCHIKKRDTPSYEIIKQYDAPRLFLQHGNTSEDNDLIAYGREHLSVLYGEHSAHKHPPLTPFDRVLPSSQSMAASINNAMIDLLQASDEQKNNGLMLKAKKGRESTHILIHPTSTDPHRNYPPAKFIKLTKTLVSDGFNVTWCMHPKERETWIDHVPKGAKLPLLPSLYDTAMLLASGSLLVGNDSGLGHLASNIGLPSLIFSNSRRHIARWRPDFTPSTILSPPRLIPNIKPWRLQETYWHHFISNKKVLKTINTLLRPV